MSFSRLQAQHRLGASEEEALRFGGVGFSINQRGKGFAYQLTHLTCAQFGHHPGVGSDTRVGRLDDFAIRQVVVAVHQVYEQHARFGVVVGALDDLFP